MKRTLLLIFILMTSCVKDDPCGNGILDPGESCDQQALGPTRCKDIVNIGQHPGGQISCNLDCTMNLDKCEPCWTYPCAPEGGYNVDIILGDVIENQSFTPGNQIAKDLSGDDDMLDFSDFYMMSEAHDRGLKGLMIFSTTGWCPYCSLEAEDLSQIYDEYRARGIIIMGLVVQDELGQDATVEYANSYSEKYNWNIPAAAGALPVEYWPSRNTAIYFPLNTFIDLTTMRVVIVAEGYLDVPNLRRLLDDLIDYAGEEQ